MYYGSAEELWIPYNVDHPHLPKHGPAQSVEIIPQVMDLIVSLSADEASPDATAIFPLFSLNSLYHPFNITWISFPWSPAQVCMAWPCPLNTPSYLSLLKQFTNFARWAPTIALLYPPPWVPADSTGIPWNVRIPLGICMNGRNVQFLWIPMDSQWNFREIPWKFQNNSYGFPMEFEWNSSGFLVEIPLRFQNDSTQIPLRFHSDSRIIPSGIWMKFPQLHIG